MMTLCAGLVLFFGAHIIGIVAPEWRAAQVARLGLMGWQAGYSLISLIGLGFIVVGYSCAHFAAPVVYAPPVWMKHVTVLLMLPVFPLLFATYLPGRLQSAAKHPMLAAVKIWAFAHVLANGALTDLLLFGSFLVWAVASRIALKYRTATPVPGAPPYRGNDFIAVVGGIGVYLLFLLWLHPVLFGVRVLG